MNQLHLPLSNAAVGCTLSVINTKITRMAIAAFCTHEIKAEDEGDGYETKKMGDQHAGDEYGGNCGITNGCVRLYTRNAPLTRNATEGAVEQLIIPSETKSGTTPNRKFSF
jgi:hypothetical protein